MSPWHELLALATRCSSPHNVQPWRVRILDDATAELFIEQRRTLPREDTTGSFMLLTMGLFLAALRLAGASRGLALSYVTREDPEAFRADRLALRPEAFVAFATLHLAPDPGARPDFPPEVLRARRTCRLPLFDEPVAETTLERIAAVARAHGQAFSWTTDRDRIETALAMDAAAVVHDLNDRGYHDELTSWFRLTAAESARHRDGLDARCLNSSTLELLMVQRAPWLVRTPGLAPLFRRRYRHRVGPVPTLGWLAGPFWKPADAFACGEALHHVWLTITACGLAIHPFGNLVTNRPTAARHEALQGARDVWLVFKLGRGPEAPESHRRAVEGILL